MIFDKSEAGLVWAPDHLNLTDKLIQMYNNENPTKGGGESKTKSSGAAP